MRIIRIKEMTEMLETDSAYKYSIENQDIELLKLVLKMYKFPYDLETCQAVLDFEASVADQGMTYYERSKGITISHLRAIEELVEHGVTSEAETEEFYADLGHHETYQAQAVLAWLGY